ncbi:FAD-binding oxidoreductase [Alphaproteobacteria bacterium]|nr:FAD-binding oxidoreductase [Alphaproteobacteria bacterium]
MKKIIVIGGGIVGASFAYHASKYDLKKITILTDALPGDTKQATSNTWGWVNGYSDNDKNYADFRLANLDYWPKLLQELNNIMPTSKGAFIWDMDQEDLNQTIVKHQNWGHSVEILPQSEIEKSLPELKKTPMMAGFGENDLAIEGPKITANLIDKSRCEVLQKKVTGLVYDNNHVIGVKTEKEIIDADEVIIAAGLGAPALLSSINVNFEMKSSMGLLAYSKPLPLLLKHPITGKEFHARQDDQGRLIIGGKFDDDASKEKDMQIAAEKLIQDMASRLNYNGIMTLDYFTIGSRPLPVDGRPKIGRLKNQLSKDIKGIYLAVMHSGITNAPLAGKLGIAEIMNGERHRLLSDFMPQQVTASETS